ncbi:MAG: hypothetical protein K2X84_06645 [Beijerinckiaceae bacterium]|nr:hypothetical protein [Beijerinckiaceae bacterium]
MTDVVERPLIGIPTSESIAKEIMDGDVDLAAIGLTTDVVAGSHDLARTVRRHVEAALGGDDQDMVGRCLERVRASDAAISLEFLAILAHARANAATWLVIQDRLDHIRIPGGPGANIMSPGVDRSLVNPHVHVGHSRYRMPGGVLSVPLQLLPATIAVAAPGRPLRSILSHPALDGFDHVVTWIHEHEDQTEIGYGPDHPTIALSEMEPGLMWPDRQALERIQDLARELRDTASEDMIPDMTTATA